MKKIELIDCPNCGVNDWIMLIHFDTETGGGNTYLCNNCKRATITINVGDTEEIAPLYHLNKEK